MARNLRSQLPGWLVRGAGLVAWAVAFGCGGDSKQPASATAPGAEVGFLELGEQRYSLGGTELFASAGRIFYGFQPAQRGAAQAPIFVLGGGGPGASAMFLLAHLGPTVIVERDDGRVEWTANAASLTGLGSILYLDARNTGFSYDVLGDPSDSVARREAFSVDNYNVYRDAADSWRALLAFRELHPELASAAWYFLAESYGGLRATIMLDMLLYATEYASGARTFSEPDLFAKLADFGQVRGQILLEPLWGGARQTDLTGQLLEVPGSVLDELASQAGTVYVRCSERGGVCNPFFNALGLLETIDRSPYDYRARSDWLDRHVAQVAGAATQRQALAELTGVEPAVLDRVVGVPRIGAYRFAAPSLAASYPRGDLESAWGALDPWDTYFVALNSDATNAYASSDAATLGAGINENVGSSFLRNLRSVPTFVSRAQYDLIIYGPAQSALLASLAGVVRVATVGEEIRIDFEDGASARAFSPEYASSHSVAREAGAELYDDLRDFVTRTGG